MSNYVVNYKANESDDKRPWGKWETTAVGFQSEEEGGLAFCKKLITVNPGKVLSIQMHEFRQEDWKMLSGEAIVYLGDKPTTLKPHRMKAGDEIFIPVGMWHRIENVGTEPMQFAEVQSGIYLDEKDIIRSPTEEDKRGTDEPAMECIRAEVAQKNLKWPAKATRNTISTSSAKATAFALSLALLSLQLLVS